MLARRPAPATRRDRSGSLNARMMLMLLSNM
jgi:hypothetical protein